MAASSNFQSISISQGSSGLQMGNTPSKLIKQEVHYGKFEYAWTSFVSYLIASIAYNITPGALQYFNQNENEPTISQEILVILFICLPILYMEVTLGKYTQNSIFNLQYMIPVAKGIAHMFIINVGVSTIRCVYYLTDFMLYFLLSFQRVLPWTTCPHNIPELCYYKQMPDNCTFDECQHASRLYWTYIYMDNSKTNPKPVLQRFVSMWLCWLIIFAVVHVAFKKRHRVYITFLIMFFVCFFLMLIGVLLTYGSANGLSAMFVMNGRHYLNLTKWARAVTKTTKIMTLGQTHHILSGARMSVQTPCGLWCVTFLIIFFCLTILYSLFAYGVAGIGHYNMGLPVANATSMSSYEMFFIQLPGCLSYLNAPHFWCVVYFWGCICVLTLNIISRLLSALLSITNHIKYMIKYRVYLLALFCLIGAIFGSIMLAWTHMRIARVLLTETTEHIEMLATTLLTIVVCWLYSAQTLGDDIHFLLGQQPAALWKVSWYLSPLIYIATLGYNFYNLSQYSEKKIFQFVVIALVAAPVYIFAIIQGFFYMKRRRLIGLLQPEVEWGVPDPEERHLRRLFNPRKETRSKTRRYLCKHKCLIGSKVLRLAYQQEEEHRKELFTDKDIVQIKRIFD